MLVPFLIRTVRLIRALPAFFAVMTVDAWPKVSQATTEELLEVQVYRSTVPGPAVAVSVAVLSPFARSRISTSWSSLTLGGAAFTSTTHEFWEVTPPAAAKIWARPTPTAVILPVAGSTWATLELLLDQVTVLFVAFSGLTSAFSPSWVSPTFIVMGVVGLTRTDWTGIVSGAGFTVSFHSSL